jgi:hypothetical protein
MRTKSVATLLALILLAVAVTGCAENERSSEDDAQNQATSDEEKDRGQRAKLELQGDPGTEFSGSCTIGNQEPEPISGQVPESFTYELEGRPLECEIGSEGDVRVDLSVGENVRSVQRTSGGTLNLTYENGGISSGVSSSPGSSVQRRSSSSSGITVQGPSDTTGDAGNVTSESRNVSGFDEVELNGVGNLSIQQTGSESLTVEAEEDVLPKIRTEVENGRLILGPRPGASINTTGPINYKLTVKDLNALEVSGSGDVEAEDIETDELDVTISGDRKSVV